MHTHKCWLVLLLLLLIVEVSTVKPSLILSTNPAFLKPEDSQNGSVEAWDPATNDPDKEAMTFPHCHQQGSLCTTQLERQQAPGVPQKCDPEAETRVES